MPRKAPAAKEGAGVGSGNAEKIATRTSIPAARAASIPGDPPPHVLHPVGLISIEDSRRSEGPTRQTHHDESEHQRPETRAEKEYEKEVLYERTDHDCQDAERGAREQGSESVAAVLGDRGREQLRNVLRIRLLCRCFHRESIGT